MTHLQQWLDKHAMSRFALARQLGIDKDWVYFLATPQTYALNRKIIQMKALTEISAATGIQPGVLVEDAMQWWRDSDGKTQEGRTKRAGRPAGGGGGIVAGAE